MKYFWIFTIIVFFGKLSAQKDTLHLYQIYNSFSNQGKAEWTAFENNWNYFTYSDLKTKQHIKQLDCKSCENFFAELYIEITEEGKLATVKFLKGKKCGVVIDDALLKKQFEEGLRNKLFTHVKNKMFKVKLGQVLKC